MFVRLSELALGTVTRVLVPLNVNADPNLPCVVHAPEATVPPFPRPEASATFVPLPSSNP